MLWPSMHRSLPVRMQRLAKSAVIVVLLLSPAVGAEGPTKLKPGFNLFTRQQDIQLGQEVAAEIREKVTLVNDPVLTEYVNTLGRRLAASPEASASGFTFTFEVVADRKANAFALPGGPMFINTGLLKTVSNEAQLAAAMAHEMSHVILRHGTNQASKQDLIQIPAALAGQMTNSDTLMGRLTQLGIEMGENGALLKFSREHETQADIMGSHIMAEEGYDPVQMARLFQNLAEEQGSAAFQFLADHPNPGNRSKLIKAEAFRLPERKYGYQTGQFLRMKRAVAAVHEPPPKKEEKP